MNVVIASFAKALLEDRRPRPAVINNDDPHSVAFRSCGRNWQQSAEASNSRQIEDGIFGVCGAPVVTSQLLSIDGADPALIPPLAAKALIESLT